jgi:hypothetical protein
MNAEDAMKRDWNEFIKFHQHDIVLMHYRICVFLSSVIVVRTRATQSDSQKIHLLTKNCQCFAKFCSIGIELTAMMYQAIAERLNKSI